MAVFFYGYITLDGYLAAKDHNLDCPGFTAVQGDPAAFAAQLDANQNIWVIGGNTILAPLPPGKSPAVWPVYRAGLQERQTLFCTKTPADKANRLHQRDFFGYEKAALHVVERLLEHSQEGY